MPCRTCGGVGKVQRIFGGTWRRCPACRGTGQVRDNRRHVGPPARPPVVRSEGKASPVPAGKWEGLWVDEGAGG